MGAEVMTAGGIVWRNAMTRTITLIILVMLVALLEIGAEFSRG